MVSTDIPLSSAHCFVVMPFTFLISKSLSLYINKNILSGGKFADNINDFVNMPWQNTMPNGKSAYCICTKIVIK
jgi:hypothetical protein